MKGVSISQVQPKQIFWEKKVPVPNPMYKLLKHASPTLQEKIESIIYGLNRNHGDNFTSLDLTDIQWSPCTVGNSQTGENYLDENIRDGSFAKDIRVVMKGSSEYLSVDSVFGNDVFKSIDYSISFLDWDYQPWKILRYSPGCFFKRHSDGIRNEKHFGTGILIPPSSVNRFTGGELVIYGEDSQLVITADETEWKLVVLATMTEHEVRPVESGERIVFVCPFELTQDMKYLRDEETYSGVLLLKVDETVVNKQRNNIMKKIQELENELANHRTFLETYETSKLDKFVVTEVIDLALDKLKRKKTNAFIVPMRGYYQDANPMSFDMKDSMVFSSICGYFQRQNIKIRVMNFGFKYLNDEDMSEIRLNTNCDGFSSQTPEDTIHKFEKVPIVYPTQFYEGCQAGKYLTQVSHYNDETYDNFVIAMGTFLHCSLDNVFYEGP
jgi:predicted 2-oxoglutarate/Fe(II)-dependent dioxygenase YbiX